MISKTILVGTCEADPVIATLPSGPRVANFTLITTESWKDSRSGVEKSKSERHKIAIFSDKLIDIIEARVGRGTMLFIEGRMENRSFLDGTTGVTRTAIDIVVRPYKGNVVIIGGEKDHERPEPKSSFVQHKPEPPPT